DRLELFEILRRDLVQGCVPGVIGAPANVAPLPVLRPRSQLRERDRGEQREGGERYGETPADRWLELRHCSRHLHLHTPCGLRVRIDPLPGRGARSLRLDLSGEATTG